MVVVDDTCDHQHIVAKKPKKSARFTLWYKVPEKSRVIIKYVQIPLKHRVEGRLCAKDQLDLFSYFKRTLTGDKQTDVGPLYIPHCRNVVWVKNDDDNAYAGRRRHHVMLSHGLVGGVRFQCWYSQLRLSFAEVLMLSRWEVSGSLFCVHRGCAAISALPLLVGRLAEHPACKNWLMRCWCGYRSTERYTWFAYGPADATATPSSLASL